MTNDTFGAIIFDMDDTLYLERDYVRSGFAAVGRAVGDAAFGEFCWQRFLDGVRGNTFDLALAAFSGVRAEVSDLVAIYRAHIPVISPCPDAFEFVTSTRLRTGLISDGPVRSQRAKFRALCLLPWIECPIFTAETCASKPAPASFQLAAYALDTPYEKCIYVGDNPAKDFAGAEALGMRTVRIRRKGALHESAVSGNDVSFEIESFDELESLMH